jgi:hypothetical protein
MFKRFNKGFIIAAIGALAIILTGCGESKYVDAEKMQRISLKNSQATAKKSLNDLQKALQHGQIRNAVLIKLYAKQVKEINPDFSPIIDELKKDSGINGVLFKGLKIRLEDNILKYQAARETFDASKKSDQDYYDLISKNKSTVIPEFDAIIGASGIAVYNDALSDVINALADMSNDKLPRIDGKKSSDFYKETGAKNVGAGTMLVGNDNYGQWKQDSSGNSFWAFYGQMAMLNTVMNMGMGGSPYYYNSWYSSRPYSSYNDYYGSRYSSSKYRNKRSSLNKHYKISSKTHGSYASKKYLKSNPSVSKKFNKFDNQFAAKRPQSKVLNRTNVKPKRSVSKIGNGKKYGSQFGSKSTRGSSGTRSAVRGK